MYVWCSIIASDSSEAYDYNRAVASYVTTVNQLYISLLIVGYLRYLPRLVWQKSGRLYSELRSESSLELKLLLC